MEKECLGLLDRDFHVQLPVRTKSLIHAHTAQLSIRWCKKMTGQLHDMSCMQDDLQQIALGKQPSR